MSLIDKIISRIIKNKRKPHTHISVEGDDVVLTTDGERKIFRLANLTDAFIYYHPNYVGSDIVLILGFPNGNSFQIVGDDPNWWDVLAALDRSGKIAVPYSKWILQFMAAGEEAPPLNLLTIH